MSQGPPARVAEQVAREAYGRLVASLSARTRDIAAAEDALAQAFLAALEQWPRDGVPANPAGWLTRIAQRRVADGGRQAAGQARVVELGAPLEPVHTDDEARPELPDRRLELLFVCAHPAIDPQSRTPLMLQTVLGLDAARIASAMRVAPKTMGQRLWRAKVKIRDAGIRFEVPERAELGRRLEAVLEAIYAAYGTGWEDLTAGRHQAMGLTAEAIFLARLLVELLPGEPEARGLLALLLYCEARREARRTADGAYVALSDQDLTRWNWGLIAEAEQLLEQASRPPVRLGPYQLEAAIQSAHVLQRRSGQEDPHGLALLYEGLVQLTPTLGALVARAAAVGAARGPREGLRCLDEVPPADGQTYQPYHAVRAHLLAAAGEGTQALEAYRTAAGLAEDPALKAFLLERARRLSSG